MTTARLPVVATGFATCMALMVAFLACVILWAVGFQPAMHMLLPHVLAGFPAKTLSGVLVGLVGSLVVGNILGATFALSFNIWNAIADRSQATSA